MNSCLTVGLCLLITINLVTTAFNKNEYGPYEVVWKGFNLCEGPKRGECGTVDLKVNKELGIINVTLNITQVCSISQAKITMFSVKNNVKKKVVDYNLDKPCQHFLVGSLIHAHMNATTNCRIAKGIYKAELNLNECTSKFVGDNFFYGEYYYKSVFADKQKNIFCIESVLLFEKSSKI